MSVFVVQYIFTVHFKLSNSIITLILVVHLSLNIMYLEIISILKRLIPHPRDLRSAAK